MEFRPSPGIDPERGKFIRPENNKYYGLYRRWHGIVASLIIFSINYSLIPVWLSLVPIAIAWLSGFATLAATINIIFRLNVFERNLAHFKNPIFNSQKLFEFSSYAILSATLFYVGWFGTFVIYFIPFALLLALYGALLGKQIRDLQDKHQ